MKKVVMAEKESRKIDWMITLVPLLIILGLCVLFFAFLEESNAVLGNIRFYLGDVLGTYYLVIGLGVICSP